MITSFINNGDGTFKDVSVRAGVSDPHGYHGFTAVFADVNNDGRSDVAFRGFLSRKTTPRKIFGPQ
jgi:hypothetical protein